MCVFLAASTISTAMGFPEVRTRRRFHARFNGVQQRRVETIVKQNAFVFSRRFVLARVVATTLR